MIIRMRIRGEQDWKWWLEEVREVKHGHHKVN